MAAAVQLPYLVHQLRHRPLHRHGGRDVPHGQRARIDCLARNRDRLTACPAAVRPDDGRRA
ncbi:hypothetical protein ABZ923_40995 [Streptomyces sp. NPDC046881]|uniref:hypothetical protein n=1 Tax=Streptomyces sp. NPDC046881 TaxID=3155374 RepID=UPI0033D7B5FB